MVSFAEFIRPDCEPFLQIHIHSSVIFLRDMMLTKQIIYFVVSVLAFLNQFIQLCVRAFDLKDFHHTPFPLLTLLSICCENTRLLCLPSGRLAIQLPL